MALDFTRREFLSVLGLTTAGILITGCGDDLPTTPKIPFMKKAPKALLAEASSSGPPSKVATAEISSYDRTRIRQMLEAMLDSLGGLGDIIRPGDSVGMKINCTGGGVAAAYYQDFYGMPVGELYWTHPEILRAMGELALDAGAGQLYVLEAVWDEASISDFGYAEIISDLGATFIDLNGTDPYPDYVQRPVGEDFFFYSTLTQNGILDELDCLISLSKAKQHSGAGVTHGMKNLVGTLPVPTGIYNDGQSHRAAIHAFTDYDGDTQSNLCRVIMDICRATPIQLVVNDAIHTILGSEGPWTSGDYAVETASFDRMIASKDPVAADAISTRILGFDPMAEDLTMPFRDSLNYLRLASSLGMGECDPEKIEVICSGCSRSSHLTYLPHRP